MLWLRKPLEDGGTFREYFAVLDKGRLDFYKCEQVCSGPLLDMRARLACPQDCLPLLPAPSRPTGLPGQREPGQRAAAPAVDPDAG